MQQGKYIIPESFTDKTTPIITVEQPEPAVQPAPQSSTSGLKNLYGQAMKGVGAVTSLASPWSAITTMSKLLPSSVSNEIERGQQRFINSALLGLPQQAEKKITGQTPEYAQTRSWKEDKLGSALDFASTTAGYFIPGLGWIKGLSTTGRLGKLLLAGKVPQLAKGATTGQKIARTAKVAGQQAKEGIFAGAGLMGAEIGVREALNPQDYTWQQNLTDFGYGLAGGAVIDPLAYGAIKGVGRLFGRGQTPPAQTPTATRQRSAEDLQDEWMEASNLTPNDSDLFDYLIKQKGWTIDDYRAVGYTEDSLQNLGILNKLGIPEQTPVPNPTAPTIGNATRLIRGQAPTGPVRVKKELDEIISGKPPEQAPQPETQQTLDQILNDLTPEINRRLDPPLTNKANLAKWLKKYALPNESLSKIQKRSAEELRQLAIETRKNLDTRETAIEVAKEKNIDLDALFRQTDAEKNINVQTLDNIINPQPRVETETQQTQAPEIQKTKQTPSNTQQTPFATARRQTVDDTKFVTQTKEFDQKAIENYKKENPNSSFGYRSGKLDAIEKSEGFDQQFHNRGTGHFGTGHYFFGDADKAINYGRSSTRKRGLSAVDFSKYNLFKPKNDRIAEDFHYIGKDINNTIPSIGNLPATKLRAVKKLLYDNLEKSRKNVGNLDSEKYDNLNLSEGQSNAVYDMTQAVSRLADIIQESNLDKYKTHGDYLNIEKQILDIIFKDASTSKKVLAKGFANTFSPEVKAMDSTITKIMKSFGYEGIDVRGIQGFDSGRYGSVIYNIKPDSVPKSVSKNRTLVKSTPKQKTVPTINKESLDNIINPESKPTEPESKPTEPATTTKDVESDEYLFSEQRRNDIREEINKSYEKKINDAKKTLSKTTDATGRASMNSYLKGIGYEKAAKIREEIQGDLLIPIEGGLTGKELNAKLEYLRSNYEGKEVIVDGREGVIEKTVFGKTIIKFKDGTKKFYEYEDLQKSNFQPKVDIEEIIRQQTDRKAIYDLGTEAKQLKLTDRAINTLDNLEQQMRDFLKDSKNRLSSNPVDQYAAYAGIMAVKILKGTIKAADFTAELVKEFGEDIRPYASQILQKTSQIIKQQLNNAPASQQTPSPTTIPVSQSLPNPPSTVPASQQKPSRITATVSKRLRKKGSVNVVSNLANNTNNTKPAAITPIQYNKLNSFDHHTRDVYRNLQHALGQQTADKYLNMLDDAKKENLDMQQFWLKWLEDEVIKKYNIRRGRESSKLVQMFGEQKITLAELQQRAPKNWQNIVNADKAFRFAYDKLIDDVNATRLQIHGLDVRIKDINQDPNLTAAEKKQQVDDLVNQAINEGKLVPKRSDYYRHFKDNGALYSYKNIYDTVSKIGDLTEEFKNMTNSKILTSFVSFAKKRMGNKTKYDAVAGFLDYIPAASYAVKIDPMIKPFRELGEFIKQDSQIRNIDVGNLADYLDEFADDLANVRQNLPDKAVNSIESFKLVLSAAHLVTNMVKRNLLVGNLGTVLVQGSNLANAFGYTKQYAIAGIYKTFNEFFNKNALSNQSTYLRERGFAKEYRRLDDRILMQPLNFANWLMETADMTTAKMIWNSAYAQGKAKKVADPMRYADDIARKSTAGRGVGEMPFINKGKVFNIVAPFQYDVANTLQVYRDIGINKKDVMGLASLMVAAYVSNEILKLIRGSGGQLDLINAFKEASKKDLEPVQRGGRVLGELLSNVPLGQTVAAFDGIFPKYGGKTDILGFSVPTLSREELFGAGDPTRFGEDLLLFNALRQPQYFVLPPFGGAQIRKTQEAIRALAKGKSEEDEQTRFLLDNSNPWRNLNTALFGIYTSPEGRRYLKEDQRMLSVEQSKMLDSLPKRQQKLAFEELQTTRKLNTIKSKAIDVAKDEKLTQTEKDRKIKILEEEYLKVAKNYEIFIAEQNKK